jgi:hypothetical protein
MKRYLVKFLAVCAMFVLSASYLQAQENKKPSTVADAYIISAKAGGVNFVTGNVSVTRGKGRSGYLLKGDSLEARDRVSTKDDGKAEILLNPGSFVRLAENSEFEFVTTDLDDLQVTVNKGSAIFEVITDTEFKVTVNTPKSRFYIVKTGIYRVDVMNDGNARIEVWKGRAQFEDGKGTIVKGGQMLESRSGLVAKFDRDDKDEFELWSKNRAKELDKINAKLRAREMNRALMASFSRSAFSLRNSFGLWVFDPFSRNYCFLPFGYGWSSPYGYWYNNSIWSYQIPPSIQYVVTNPGINQPPSNAQQPFPPPQSSQPVYTAPSQPSTRQPADTTPAMERGNPAIVDRKVPRID